MPSAEELTKMCDTCNRHKLEPSCSSLRFWTRLLVFITIMVIVFIWLRGG